MPRNGSVGAVGGAHYAGGVAGRRQAIPALITSARVPRSLDADERNRRYLVSMTVRVLSGPLADFDAQVTEVNAEAGKVKVVMMIFGRETPAELTLDQVSVIA